MNKIFHTPIEQKKEFNFEGRRLVFNRKDEVTGRYLYNKYFPDGRLLGYEVVQPVKAKQPDGTIVYTYPSTVQFGSHGWDLPKTSEPERIEYYMRHHKIDFKSYADWKKSQ